MSSYKCSKCDYTSCTKGLTKKHIDNVSKCKGADLLEDIVKVKCSVCNKEFDTEKLMTQHRKKCIKKKTLIVPQYLDPIQVENGLKTFGNLLLDAIKRIETLEEENNDLMKRLEKLEGTTEEEDNEEENDDPCQYFKLIKFIPTSRDQVKSVLRENEIEDMKYVVVTVKEQRSLELAGTVTKEGIEVGDVIYYYNPAKKEKSSSDLKVIIKKYCLNSAKGGCEYCKEHCQ